MNYIHYVNIKEGTKSVSRFSNGNTLPLTQMPFGMAGFVPQTSSDKGNWFYHPEDRSIEGIRLTHQPSPWIGDYGHIVLMPQCGEPYGQAGKRWSGFRPEEAVLRPDYMRINFLRYQASFELSPTERGAAIRVTYGSSEKPRFAVLPVQGTCSYQLDVENRVLTGSTTGHSWPIAENFALYFAISFDGELDPENTVIIHADGQTEKSLQGSGERVGISIALNSKKVEVRMATSYISAEQAKITLKQELDGKNFDQVKKEAEDKWESYLSRIQVETETEEQMKTFYSCLYRLFLYPHKFYEYNQEGKAVHYSPYDGTVAEGVMYTDNGFWDTFRTVYPFFSIVAPEMYAEILQGFVNIYQDSGWLPKWPSPGEVGMMPGTLIDAVIADAAVKGIGTEEVLEKALKGMLKHATQESEDARYGRHGTVAYNQYGYVPRNLYDESVNCTLDYAYGDFCIAQTAGVLGHEDIAETYRAKAKNYQTLFDKETGFMRGRDTEGNRKETFNPFEWGGEYCEGGAWQSSFAVHHDFDGLAALYGGKGKLIEKLDELFATPPIYHPGGYEYEIHEMTEMAAVDFGQCAISNQPSFHLPYLYALLGVPEKTEYWVKRIAEELFSYRDDGFPGDEDNGTMSGWYVFSSLGLYPICPGKAEYVKGIQLVKKAIINGKVFSPESFDRIIPHEAFV